MLAEKPTRRPALDPLSQKTSAPTSSQPVGPPQKEKKSKNGRLSLPNVPCNQLMESKVNWFIRRRRKPPSVQASRPSKFTLSLSSASLHRFLIRPYGTETVTSRPETHPGHTLVPQDPVNPNRTLTLQKANDMENTVLGRNLETPVHMVPHQMRLKNLNVKLPA